MLYWTYLPHISWIIPPLSCGLVLLCTFTAYRTVSGSVRLHNQAEVIRLCNGCLLSHITMENVYDSRGTSSHLFCPWFEASSYFHFNTFGTSGHSWCCNMRTGSPPSMRLLMFSFHWSILIAGCNLWCCWAAARCFIFLCIIVLTRLLGSLLLF